MKKSITFAVALVLTAGTAFAAGEAKEAKPVACLHFNEFKDANGVTMGVCGASKPGGKVRVLRSYVVTRVVDPTTDKPVAVLVGFN